MCNIYAQFWSNYLMKNSSSQNFVLKNNNLILKNIFFFNRTIISFHIICYSLLNEKFTFFFNHVKLKYSTFLFVHRPLNLSKWIVFKEFLRYRFGTFRFHISFIHFITHSFHYLTIISLTLINTSHYVFNFLYLKIHSNPIAIMLNSLKFTVKERVTHKPWLNNLWHIYHGNRNGIGKNGSTRSPSCGNMDTLASARKRYRPHKTICVRQ